MIFSSFRVFYFGTFTLGDLYFTDIFKSNINVYYNFFYIELELFIRVVNLENNIYTIIIINRIPLIDNLDQYITSSK